MEIAKNHEDESTSLRRSVQATELCSHQGANLQTTLTHLQWQKKHIEQRRMTACAMAGMTRAATGSAVHPAIAAGPLGDASSAEVNDLDGKNVIELLRSDDGADMKAEQRIGGEAKANSWYPGVDLESEVDTAQLEAKGQALAQAVLVVESVLQKMEDQVSARISRGIRGSAFPTNDHSIRPVI